MSRLGFILIAFLVIPLAAVENPPGQVTLAWDRNPENDIKGYRIYYGPLPRSKAAYTTMVEAGNVTEFTLTNLPPGPYFFAVTAVNLAGMESGYSNEVSTCDINGDGIVRPTDLQMLSSVLADYRTTCPGICDVDLNGKVEPRDFQVLQNVLLAPGPPP